MTVCGIELAAAAAAVAAVVVVAATTCNAQRGRAK